MARNYDIIQEAETENPLAYYYTMFWHALTSSGMTIIKWRKIQSFVIRG